MKKTISALSCVCLVVLLGAGAWHWNKTAGNIPSDLDGGGLDGDPAGYSAGNDQEKQSDAQMGMEEEAEGEFDSLEDLDAEAQAQDEIEVSTSSCYPGTDGADAPAEESLVATGNLKVYSAVWGGSYIDEQGRTVVLLTENTEENRQAVFEMNPDLLESSTVFQEADYTLLYLTELQECISEMMAAGELPFVITSALMEDLNRVRVTVQTRDYEEIDPVAMERLQKIDSIGGAIEIVYNPEGAVGE